MNFFQSFIGNVGIDLSSGDRGVAEHRLNRTDIGAVHEEIGRETVAEGMRMDILHDAGFFRIVLDQPCDGPRREAERIALCIFFVHETFFRV